MYLKKGLRKSEFVNLKVRQLSAETTHDFIEWCGLLDGQGENRNLIPGVKLYKQDLYFDFVPQTLAYRTHPKV